MAAPTSTTNSNINAVGFTAGSEGFVGPMPAYPMVAGGSTLTLTAASHGGKVIKLDTLTGSVITLPAATGSGVIYRFLTTVIATSNSHKIQVPDATTYLNGSLIVVDDAAGTCTVFGTTGATTTRSDTITLNRGTTGSAAVGEYIEIQDTSTNNFSVRGSVIATGVEATPFSAAV